MFTRSQQLLEKKSWKTFFCLLTSRPLESQCFAMFWSCDGTKPGLAREHAVSIPLTLTLIVNWYMCICFLLLFLFSRFSQVVTIPQKPHLASYNLPFQAQTLHTEQLPPPPRKASLQPPCTWLHSCPEASRPRPSSPRLFHGQRQPSSSKPGDPPA